MKRTLILLSAMSIVVTPTANAAVSDEDFEELRQQLAAVSLRLDQLAAENAELRRNQAETSPDVQDVQPVEALATTEPWTDRVRLQGDFRYRYERIDAEGNAKRSRNRIRARTNIIADLSDDVEVGFGLATGGDAPVSTNQTLGGGGSSKSISLNLAYVDWGFDNGLSVIGGKFKNPLVRAGKQGLVWDGDWTPEGFALTYERDMFFANALGTFLESDSNNSNDNFSWGAQFGMAGHVGDAKIKGGVGYYSIKTAGEHTTFGDPSDPGDYFGNTAVEAGGLACGTTPDAGCAYLYDYLLTEVFAEASFEVRGWPALVYVDYVQNSDPTDNDTAWVVGTIIGQAKDRGEFQLGYYYVEKEADAVLGLLTDSDFGNGGTDNRGHSLSLTYGVNKTFALGAQYFINETDIRSGTKSDYNRLMIDAQFKWQ